MLPTTGMHRSEKINKYTYKIVQKHFHFHKKRSCRTIEACGFAFNVLFLTKNILCRNIIFILVLYLLWCVAAGLYNS